MELMTNALVEVDLIQAEWVVVAFLSQDTNMLNVVRSGVDPHLRTGSLITGAPESFIIYENELVGHLTDPKDIVKARLPMPRDWEGVPISSFFLPRSMSGRQAGKKSNHGLNYGMRYRRFALENGMQEGEASTIVAIYRDTAYPGLKDFHQWVEHLLRRDHRRLTNYFGQSAEFMDEWSADLLDAAYAFYPQSTVGNVTNFGWRSLYHDSSRVMRRVEPRMQMHDSVIAHHTFGSWTELAMQCIRLLDHMTEVCEYHSEPFILGRELKIGCNLSENAMKTVIQVPLNQSIDHIDGSLVTQLEEAWDASCASAIKGHPRRMVEVHEGDI